MKKLLLFCVAITLVLALSGITQADPFKQVWLDNGPDLTDLQNKPISNTIGAINYTGNSSSAGNAAASGKFFDYLDTKVDLFSTGHITGNFAMFGVFKYEAGDVDFLSYMQSNPNELLSWWVEFDNLHFDDSNYNKPLYQLTDKDAIRASYNDIAAVGWTQTGDTYMDLILINETQGLMALGFVTTYDLGADSFDLAIINDGITRNSRLGYSPIPEPATMMLFGLGLLGFAGVSRKRNRN